ncbi:MAG: cupin domain-containing protein [Rectinemataceae bacterium]
MSETYFPRVSFPEVPLRQGGPSRRLIAFGGSLMLAEMDFETGALSEAHAHPEEQLTYCASGKFETNVGGLPGRLETGDSFYAGPAVPHGVRCLEKGKLLHVFTPQRVDYK